MAAHSAPTVHIFASSFVHRHAASLGAPSREMEQLLLPETEYMRVVGDRLRRLIDALGISYVEAARDMGVTRNQLGNWMRGNHGFPRHYALYRFARIRGVNVDWILLGDPSGLPKKVADALLGLEPGSVATQARVPQAS